MKLTPLELLTIWVCAVGCGTGIQMPFGTVLADEITLIERVGQ